MFITGPMWILSPHFKLSTTAILLTWSGTSISSLILKFISRYSVSNTQCAKMCPCHINSKLQLGSHIYVIYICFSLSNKHTPLKGCKENKTFTIRWTYFQPDRLFGVTLQLKLNLTLMHVHIHEFYTYLS